jgi:LEA14-like dessication related protein
LLLVATFAACADTPRLESPRVTVDSVRIDRITGAEASFIVTLNLTNPNAREIAVDAIDANLTIEGVPVGNATLKAPLRLPANGEAQATLQARAGIAAVLRVAAEMSQRAQEQKAAGQGTRIRYAVNGSATLEGGWPVPFSRDGDFRLGAPAPR